MNNKIGCKMMQCPLALRFIDNPLLRTSKGRIAALFFLAFIFYFVIIVLFNSVGFGADLMSNVMDPDVESHPDIPFYQFRTSAILNGQVPYLDFDTESPPLIMYLMIPAAIMGNSMLAYAVMFSAYAFLTAGILYTFLRRYGELRALMAVAFFLFNPITWATAVVFIQDEMIVTLFYVLPVLLLLFDRVDWSASMAVLGTMTKVFSIVLVPLVIIKQHGKARIRAIFISGATLLAVAVPFIILAGEDFLFFLDYYASQSGQLGHNEGVSIWRFLHDAGIVVPGLILQILFAVGTLVVLYLIWKKDIDPVRSGFLLLMPFFLFFPKIFTCYFIIPFSVLCILSLQQRWPMLMITVAAFLAFFCQFFESFGDYSSALPTEGWWMAVPILLSLGVHVIWMHLTFTMLRAESDLSFSSDPPSLEKPLHSDSASR